MKYDQIVIDKANLDWTTAQALEGETVEAQVFQLKANIEPMLGALHDKVNVELAEIDKLRESAHTIPAELNDSEVVLADLWIAAKAILVHFHQHHLRAKQELKAYALHHGITRSPIAPDLFQNCLVLGLFIALESILNAGFLNNAYMVAGPVQALMAAFMISLTNVAVSTAGGYFIGRWLSFGLHTAEPNNPEFKKKRDAAWAALIGFLIVMLQFHLTVGLIRTQETLHHIEHSIPRYLEIFTTPEALFLVMVGIVMSGISWKKGMSAFDDPYPGYGNKQSRVDQMQEQGMEECNEIKTQISERVSEKREAIKKAEKEVSENIKKHNQKVADCQKSVRTLNRYINDAENQLRFEIAKIAHHHRPASNHAGRRINMASLEHCVHFNNYRIHNPPAFLSTPDFLPSSAAWTRPKPKPCSV